MRIVDPSNNPLLSMDDCDDFNQLKYEEKTSAEEKICDSGKTAEEFRNYVDGERQERVSKFYALQHANQTVDFVKEQKKKYCTFDKCEMGIWECLELLNSLTDESDPDTDVSQLQHALMTAEAIRKNYPGEEYDWFWVTGLIHDLGKILSMKFEEPQWAVVGDTFPVGCKHDKSIVFHDTFDVNPDTLVPEYKTELGMYSANCGLENLEMSWGHDEYLYQVCVHNGCTLPEEGLYIIRYHSFYPWHKEGAYRQFMNEKDQTMLPWVQKFNPFDLYSKGDLPKDVAALCEFYKEKILKYFPKLLKW
jgi:inositol oxygenase